MDKIDRYLNSIYRDVSDSSKETKDLKLEMRNHLMETVKELQTNGINEEESIRIAIERFGEEFQLRNELNQVLRFQKVFAQKTLISSLFFLALSVIFLITSFFVHRGFLKRYNAMNSQITLVENKLVTEGINGVDKYLKELFKNEQSNQLTYVVIKELSKDFDITKSKEAFPGKVKYSFPQEIKNEYYNNRLGTELVINNMKYLIETGTQTSANIDKTSLFVGLAILTFALCWVLWIIWSIINVYRYGKLNTNWIMLLISTGIIGYFIFLSYVNPNNKSNKRNEIIVISIFALIVITFILFYVLREPYKVQRLYDLILH